MLPYNIVVEIGRDINLKINYILSVPACLQIEPTQHCYGAEASCQPSTRYILTIDNIEIVQFVQASIKIKHFASHPLDAKNLN